LEGFEIPGACNCQPRKKPRGRELTELEKHLHERAARFGVSPPGIAYALKPLKIFRKKQPSNTQKPIKKHNNSSRLR
jgi:hypothetical protein